MSSAAARKRRLDLDPLADDPDDLDYGAPSPPRSARKQSSRPKDRKRSKKRRRRGNEDDDSDIDDGEEDELSRGSWSSEQESEGEPIVNPVTGRRVRAVAAKQVKYEEDSDEEERSSVEDTIEEDDEEEVPTKRRKKRAVTEDEDDEEEVIKVETKSRGKLRGDSKQASKRGGGRRMSTQSQSSLPGTLIVKLSLKSEVLERFSAPDPTRQMDVKGRKSSRTGSRATSVASQAPSRRGARRSEEPEDLFELDNTGRPRAVSSGPSSSQGAQDAGDRPQHGGKSAAGKSTAGKAPLKIPSAIMEGSHEDSQSQAAQRTQADDDDDEIEEVPAAEGDTADDGNASSDEDVVVNRSSRRSLTRRGGVVDLDDSEDELAAKQSPPKTRSRDGSSNGAKKQSSPQKRKRGDDEDDDFDPDSGSGSDNPEIEEEPSSKRARHGASQQPQQRDEDMDFDEEDEWDEDELAEEARNLSRESRRRTRGQRNKQSAEDGSILTRPKRNTQYKEGMFAFGEVFGDLNREIQRNETGEIIGGDTAGEVGSQGSRSRAKRAQVPILQRILQTGGIFGGNGMDDARRPSALPGGLLLPGDGSEARPLQKVGGYTSDSSDDERALFTPTTGKKKSAPGFAEDFGKVDLSKSVPNENFDAEAGFQTVGGVDDHVNQLKDMLILPLQYPEVFTRFGAKPPRGVLFHGPPGTGKTSLARAVAAEMSHGGRKVTFFVRKGADVLSKYSGEAERQLKALFDEAKRCQPSIIFFDEIDGLAPKRRADMEQIHSTIVACLLAHMDGLDDRGQVVIIGATNRPDQLDDALRRPGRFDKELYFPLPNLDGRRSIIGIHTRKFTPPLAKEFQQTLAEMTKGFSGADIEAMCTESTLGAIQREYPQIYKSNQKLLIDPSKIQVQPRDFIRAMQNIVPTAERYSASGESKAFKKRVQPLIRQTVDDIILMIERAMPRQKKTTALEDAMFEDHDDPNALMFWEMEKELRESRVHRPRLLVSGPRGMGQQYLKTAVLQRLEAMHMQPFDLPTLVGEGNINFELTMVSLFKEVKRHKPAIIFIPDIDSWWSSLDQVKSDVFCQLLQTLDPNDPVLLLGIMSTNNAEEKPDPVMLRELFSFSSKNRYDIVRPDDEARREFFTGITAYIRKSPDQLPQPEHRKPRKLAELPPAPSEVSQEQTGKQEQDLKESLEYDLVQLNIMKMRLQNIVKNWDNEKKMRFLASNVLDHNNAPYLVGNEESDPLPSDLPVDQLQAMNLEKQYVPYLDKKGVPGFLHIASNTMFYILTMPTVVERLQNGYYATPDDLIKDIERIAKDWENFHRLFPHANSFELSRRAAETHLNISVDISTIKFDQPLLWQKWETAAARQKAREELRTTKRAEKAAAGQKAVQNARLAAQNQQQAQQPQSQNGAGPATQRKQPLESSPLANFMSTANNKRRREGEEENEASATKKPRQGDESQATSNGISQQPVTPHQIASQTQPFSQQHTQRSALEKMAPGSQPHEYHNSASTTTSGQKTGSNGTGTNLGRSYPDFTTLDEISGSSQIPDTQPNSNGQPSSGGDHSSDRRSIPASAPASLAAYSPAGVSAPQFPVPPAPQSQFTLDEQFLAQFLDDLVAQSAGLGVEQLERVHAALATVIWESRTVWNRNHVVKACQTAFKDVAKDILVAEGVERSEEESILRSPTLNR